MSNELFEKIRWDWNKCDPRVPHKGRRDRNSQLKVIAGGVTKSFQQLAVASCAFLPVVGTRRELLNTVAAYPPNTPLSRFIEHGDHLAHFQVSFISHSVMAAGPFIQL